MKKWIRRMLWKLNTRFNGEPEQWKRELHQAKETLAKRAAAQFNKAAKEDYDAYLEQAYRPVTHPIAKMLQALESNKPVKLPGMAKSARIDIDRAVLFEARVDERGRLIPKNLLKENEEPHQLTIVEGRDDFLAAHKKLDGQLPTLRVKAREAREQKKKYLTEKMAKFKAQLAEIQKLPEEDREPAETLLREDFWTGDDFASGSFVNTGGPIDQITTSYDRAQFTEFTPIFGNQFYKQQYMYDMLATFAQSYEAWNHNPLAKRAVNHLRQYVIGRRVKMVSKNDAAVDAWNDFDDEFRLMRHLRFWFVERTIYGELMLRKSTWQTIDPSSIWEIVHVPENVEEQLYYYQAFMSDYQMFTGIKVPGVPGSEKAPVVKFTINQIPADEVLHMRDECVSNEKRGRSKLFPMLGWLKRHKDVLTAITIKEQLEASFIWDDEITGDDADVVAHAQAYSGMPAPASVFAHNQMVKRTAVRVSEGGTGANRGSVLDYLVAHIAMGLGIPKEHFNVQGSGSRSSSLVGSEPFTKVIDEMQSEWKELLHEIAKIELPKRGVEYNKDEIEFIFPEATKDTTSEKVKNIMLGEQEGYISQRRAAEMFAAEMDIATYDFEDEQNTIASDKAAGLDLQGPPIPTAGKTGFGGSGSDGTGTSQGGIGDSEIHGDGNVELADQLMTL